MTKKAGRPTDYNEDILKKTEKYLKTRKGEQVPSVAGLSRYLGIARSTIYDWASQESKKDFSDMLGQILSEQEKLLINKGLAGDFNSTIAKLMLAKHGYTDKQEITGKDGTPLIPEEKKQIDKALQDTLGDN